MKHILSIVLLLSASSLGAENLKRHFREEVPYSKVDQPELYEAYLLGFHDLVTVIIHDPTYENQVRKLAGLPVDPENETIPDWLKDELSFLRTTVDAQETPQSAYNRGYLVALGMLNKKGLEIAEVSMKIYLQRIQEISRRDTQSMSESGSEGD